MDIEKMVREKIRSQGKADGTADAYFGWVDRYLKFCVKNKIKKGDMPAERAVEKFLSMLANDRDVSANTQNQAFSALCYFYRHVLKRPLVDVSALRAKRPDRIRDIADQSEIVAMLDELTGVANLVAQMIYGCSFRIGEAGRLRIRDISKPRKQIIIKSAKGEKDRVVGYPVELHDAVDRQIESMRVLWKHDVANGMNGVSLPKAYGRKSPRSHLDFSWYYLFCADNVSKCPVSGRLLRHHRHMGHIGTQIKEASLRAGIPKNITSHCLRHSHATHSLEQGVPLHHVQARMGHNDTETTKRYLHATVDGVTSAKSPLEQLLANPPVRDRAVTTTEPFKLRVVG
jgi:integron integrase